MNRVAPTIVAGRYRLEDTLGAGGMGTVRRARDCETGRIVAIKLPHEHRANDAVAAQYLRAEAAAAGRCRHPHVVDILGGGDDYVVMELVEGEPLGTTVKETGPLPVQRASAIVRQVLSGLDAIHATGYLHGDVKTDNVMVARDAERDAAKLIDLGLTRPIAAARTGARTYASGTPDYMAPEVIRGEVTDVGADLYGAGVVLYELLTGSTPFGGGTSDEIMQRHLHDAVVSPSLRCPDRPISDALERVIVRALEKDPKARFASAAEFAAALRAATPLAEPPLPRTTDRIAFSTSAPTVTWHAP